MEELLQVIEWENALNESIVIDPYVPLEVTWGNWDPALDTHVYWRTGDFSNSILEICCVKESGLIRNITLVLADKSQVYQAVNGSQLANRPVGIPVVGTNHLEELRPYDVPEVLQVGLSEDSVVIKWGQVQPCLYVGSGGRVRFGLDRTSRLVLLEVVGNTPVEMVQLREALRKDW